MKEWLVKCPAFAPRPVVFMDDHARHVPEFCEAVREAEAYPGELLSQCTIVLVDNPGPDTEYHVVDALFKYPELQLVAGPFDAKLATRLVAYEAASLRKQPLAGASDLDKLVAAGGPLTAGQLSGRFMDLPRDVSEQHPALVELLDDVVRPGGLIVSDIEMKTLRFTRDDVYLGVDAAWIASRKQVNIAEPVQAAAQLLVVSNRTYFGLRVDTILNERGIEVAATDVLRKKADIKHVVRRVVDTARERFPWKLHMRNADGGKVITVPVGQADEPIINQSLDVVVWPKRDNKFPVTGRAVEEPKSLRGSGGQALVLLLMIQRHLQGAGDSVSNDEIYDKLKVADPPEDQTPAQVVSSIATRLLGAHGRKIIPKADHGCYRFGDVAKVGLILPA